MSDNTIAGQTRSVSRAEVELLYEAVKYAYARAKDAQNAGGEAVPRHVKEAMHSIVAIVDRFDRVSGLP